MLNWLNKNNRKKENLIFLILFVTFFLISFRKIFSIKGILGHNWDWPFPALDFLFKKIDLWSRFAWWDFNLGLPLSLNLSQLGPNTLVKILAFIFMPKVVILVWIFLLCLAAFLSFKKLLDFINQKTFLNYLPAFLFAFSPFLFNDIIGGSWYMWVSYAAAPLFFLNLVKFIERGKIKFLFGFLIASIFVIASLQHFLLIEVIALGYFAFQLLSHHITNFKKLLQRYFLAQTTLIIFNLYWLLPFFYSFSGFVKSVSQASFTGAFASVRYSTQNLLSIASLVGYLDRNLYYYALTKPLVVLMALAVFLIWASIISFFVWGENNDKIKASGWLIILFLLVLLIKGGNEPLGELTMWIYNHFPLMKLYRSPQHLMFAAAFIVPVLFSFSLNFFYQRFIKYRKMILAGFIFCLFFWLAGWWFNGDLGHAILKNQKRDYVDFYQLSPGITEVYRQNEQSDANGRVFFLPPVNSAAYLPNEYQNLAYGGQPEYIYLKNPTFTSENIFFAKEIENAFCHNLKINYLNYLSLFSVKQLVLRADIFPLYDQLSTNNCWGLGKVKSILDTFSELTNFLEDKYTVAYQVADEKFLPYFYIPEKMIEDSGDVQDLKEIVDFQDYQIKSGIYLTKKNEGISQFKPVSDEIFIKADLENPVDKNYFEKLEAFKNSVPFPHVRHEPGSFFYPLVLKKEQFEEWKLRKNPEKLVDKKLFYAGKRIVEVEKYATDAAKYDRNTMEIYKKKMEEAIKEIEKLRNLENLEGMTIKIRAYWEKHKEKIEEIYENKLKSVHDGTKYTKMTDNWEGVFGELDGKIKTLEEPFDLRNLKYSFTIPKKGVYSLFVGNIDRLTDLGIEIDGNTIEINRNKIETNGEWVKLGEKEFEEGNHQLVLHLPEQENLVGDSWQKLEEIKVKEEEVEFSPQTFFPDTQNLVFQEIKDWQPGNLYYLSFDYRMEGGIFGVGVLEEKEVIGDGKEMVKTEKIFNKTLKGKDKEWEEFETILKADRDALGASVYFYALVVPNQIAKVNFRNLKIQKIINPKIVLRSTKYQALNLKPQTPMITFVKLNPTKYQVKIQGATKPFNLIFNQSFNRGWKVYSKGGKSQISEENHWLANGYANAWQIDPQDNNGVQDDDLIIEYFPQKLYYIGLILSAVILLILISLTIRQKIKNSK